MEFGPQSWWPAECEFEMIIGALLTQNTSWENTSRAISNLRSAGVLSPRALYSLTDEEIEGLIRPSGYFRQKTGRMKNFLHFLFSGHNGDLEHLLALDKDNLRSQLLTIKGIGPETADSIVLYAAGKPSFVVDKYTSRLFSRIGLVEEDATYDEIKHIMEECLPQDTQLFNEYHALIVAHGNRICKKRNPDCSNCPIREECTNPK